MPSVSSWICLGSSILFFLLMVVLPSTLSTCKYQKQTDDSLKWSKQQYLGDQLRRDCVDLKECDAYEEFKRNIRKEVE